MRQDPLVAAEWFPDRLDWQHGLIRLLRVNRETLRDSAFLDGRTPLSAPDGEAQIVPLERFVAAVPPAPHRPRWIFHEGFCGSTLLARMLTVDGRCLCLREPQVLVDLAAWSAAAPRDPRFRAALRAIVAKLVQPWGEGERIAIKPTNWLNTIAVQLLDAAPNSRAVLVTIAADDFLVAVLRGGRERIAFVLDLQQQIVRARPDLAAAYAAVIEVAPDDPTSLLRHIAATHAMQRRLLDEIGEADLRLAFPAWTAAPSPSASHAAAALDLTMPDEALQRQVRRSTRFHSKTTHASYTPRQDIEANEAIRHMHGRAIEQAIAHVSDLV